MECFELKYRKPIPPNNYLVKREIDLAVSRVISHLMTFGYNEQSAKDILNHVAAKHAQYGWNY